MAGLKDELLYFGAGVAIETIANELEKKYADPKEGMNFPTAKGFGKPSVYAPLGTGIVAGGYVYNKLEKTGRLEEEDFVLAGYAAAGITRGLITGIKDTIAASQTQATSRAVNFAGAGAMRPSITVRDANTRVSGYPAAADGVKRGLI